MKPAAAVVVAMPVAAALLAGCGARGAGVSDEPSSGVSGVVWLAPTCPVEQEGQPCDAERAAEVSVTVARPTDQGGGIGDVVARGRTDGEGRFRIAVEPGTYVVTADAGMLCKPLEVRVSSGEVTRLDVSCDTGIR